MCEGPAFHTEQAHGKLKRGRHHADHRVAVAAERQCPADDFGIGGEAAAPQSVTEQHDIVTSRLVLIGGKCPSQLWLGAEQGEETGGYSSARNTLGQIAAGEIEICRIECGKMRE